MSDQELYHYGVKGMKWGVRKDKKYKTRVVKEWDDVSDYGYKMKRKQWQDDNGRWWTGGAAKVKLTKRAKKGLTRAERKEWKKALMDSINADTYEKNREALKRVEKCYDKSYLREYNEKRALKEITAYEKKVGGNFAKKYMDVWGKDYATQWIGTNKRDLERITPYYLDRD